MHPSFEKTHVEEKDVDRVNVSKPALSPEGRCALPSAPRPPAIDGASGV